MYIDNTYCLKHDVGFDDIKRMEDSLNNVASDLTLFENRTNDNFTEVRQSISDTKNDYNAHFITNLLDVNAGNFNHLNADMLNVKESHTDEAFIDDLHLSSPVSDMTVTNLHVDNLDAVGGNLYNVNLKNVRVDVMNMTPIYTDDVLGYDDNGNLIPVHASYDIGLPNNADYISTDSDGTPIPMKNSIKVDPVNNLITSFGVYNEFHNLNNALDEKFNTIDNALNDVNNNISNIENAEVVIPSSVINDFRFNTNINTIVIANITENNYDETNSVFYYDSKYIYTYNYNNDIAFHIRYKNNHNLVSNLNLPLEVISPSFFTVENNGVFNDYWLKHYSRNTLELHKNVTFSNLYRNFQFFTINNIYIDEIRDSNFYLCRDRFDMGFPHYDYNSYMTNADTTFTHKVDIGLNNAKVVLTSPTLNKVRLYATNTDVNRMSEVNIFTVNNFSFDYNAGFFGNETNHYRDPTLELPIGGEEFNHYINKNLHSIVYKHKDEKSFLYKDLNNEKYYYDAELTNFYGDVIPSYYMPYGCNYYKAEVDELLFDLKRIGGLSASAWNYYYSEFNGEIRLNSMVTNISFLLSDCIYFNQPINIPNNVVEIEHAFYECHNFNQPINIPNSVVYMADAFYGCHNFNQPINIPNSVVGMGGAFQECYNFNQPINIPNSVVGMGRAFYECYNFNSPINIPNGVVSMISAFCDCHNFNQPINIPNSVAVGGFMQTFLNCYNFNQPINIPNGVLSLRSTFYECHNFNQPINIPNNVLDMGYTFVNCYNFNSPINLYVTNKVNMEQVFLGCDNLNSPIHITSDHLLDASDNVYNQLTNGYAGKAIPSSLIFNDL